MADFRVDELVDRPLVGCGGFARRQVTGLFAGEQHGWMGLMRWRRDQIELCRIGSIRALEADVLGTLADIQAIIFGKIVIRAVDDDAA